MLLPGRTCSLAWFAERRIHPDKNRRAVCATRERCKEHMLADMGARLNAALTARASETETSKPPEGLGYLFRGILVIVVSSTAMGEARSSQNVSEIMRSVRSKGTLPELAFRKALRARGLHYRIAPSSLAGKPDLVIPDHRVAIFIDGDFWHGGQWSKRKLVSLEDQFHSTPSKEYWLEKITRNVFRDCSATDFLVSQGWTVLRYWESDVLKNLESCMNVCLAAIEDRASFDPFWVVPSKTFAEFFAGIGLMRMGLERQCWTSKFANDNDPQKLEMDRARLDAGLSGRCQSHLRRSSACVH